MNKHIRLVSIPQITGFVGLATASVAVLLWPARDPFEPAADYTVRYLLVVFAAMAVVELVVLRSYNQIGSGLRLNLANFGNRDYREALLVKLLGLAATLALITGFYFTADLYTDIWYRPFFTFLEDHSALIAAIVLTNFVATHYCMRKPRDGYWHTGIFALTLGRQGNRKTIRNHLVGMAVKTYFLPLMFCYAVYDMAYLIDFDYRSIDSFTRFYDFAFRYLFFMDITIVVIGYTFSIRLFNAHIRWPDTTMGGWLVCLLCYMPFWQMFRSTYFDYFSDGTSWGPWLSDYPVLYTLWGSTILALILLYMYSVTQFGMRFSNLTYRGLVSSGMYRISKHPSYLFKNITWWMISVPFVAADWRIALGNCLALAGVNFIYYMRAKYEEKCLSVSPSYRLYMAHINQHGLVAQVRRKLAGILRPNGRDTQGKRLRG